ncbi:hypothetical protein SAMN05444682_102307 [Parapedobacter indicus]|uniref:Uncharacterized protein n=1 Tax=Parapedobacter indicus TaxID=1477437 RepID=A0A1I3FFD4_9SPHI|nr:hypothetical protein CLV26_102307 [Parapedobacter indicus]SFI09929.1 hypothetical protein SAMN05444682_102307 [Parapedobacter indicus]
MPQYGFSIQLDFHIFVSVWLGIVSSQDKVLHFIEPPSGFRLQPESGLFLGYHNLVSLLVIDKGVSIKS